MGRIKSIAIKNLAKAIAEEHKDRFSTDFENNKKAVSEFRKIDSKKIRNMVAGYITSEKDREKKESA